MKIVAIFLTLFAFIGTTAQESPRKLRPTSSIILDNRILEGSGLAFWDGKLWTHNDSGTASLFALDVNSGEITAEYPIPNVKNTDWEELSQDSLHFYVGNFGNNYGIRDTLQIIRIDKQSLLVGDPKIDFIRFHWSSADNPDCEAMVVVADTIYLFTKEWKRNRRTRMFSVPSVPGIHQAKHIGTFRTRVAVTGATFFEDKLILCGYNRWIRPHLLEFSNFTGHQFFKGDYRKIKVRKCFTQIEGIATSDGNEYFMISELFDFLFIKTRQKLHTLKL